SPHTVTSSSLAPAISPTSTSTRTVNPVTASPHPGRRSPSTPPSPAPAPTGCSWTSSTATPSAPPPSPCAPRAEVARPTATWSAHTPAAGGSTIEHPRCRMTSIGTMTPGGHAGAGWRGEEYSAAAEHHRAVDDWFLTRHPPRAWDTVVDL